MSSVGGSIEEPAMAKALNRWANLGVIKEREGGEFVLLEVQEEGGVKPIVPRQGRLPAYLLYPIIPLTNEQR